MDERKLKEAFAKIKEEIGDLRKEISETNGKKKGKEIVVAFSGYFDPIHKGHIEGLELAKELGDKLIAIVNSDLQCNLKKGFSFMPQDERMKIIKALRFVDEVVLSIDSDQTQCKTLEFLKPDIFAKGGDRKVGEIPETPTCKKNNIKVVDGLGKKIQSSSWLIKAAEDSEKALKKKKKSSKKGKKANKK